MQYLDIRDNDEPLENNSTRTLIKKGNWYQGHCRQNLNPGPNTSVLSRALEVSWAWLSA